MPSAAFPLRLRRLLSIRHALATEPATVRGKNAQKLSPNRDEAGSSGLDPYVMTTVVLDVRMPVPGLRQRDLR